MVTYKGKRTNFWLIGLKERWRISDEVSLYEAINFPTGITMYRDKETYLKYHEKPLQMSESEKHAHLKAKLQKKHRG